MKIHRASHLGMCFGVRDAIQLALDRAGEEPVTILGDLVHNPTVLGRLRRQGVRIETDLERVQTGSVLITAHGASSRRIQAVRDQGLRVGEATCPLVQVAHRALGSLVSAGYHPVIIGIRDHVEVRGLTEDLDAYEIILNEEDLEMLEARARFGVVAQTTQPIARVRGLVALLRQRFPGSEVRWIDTVCQPTKQRQQAAEELARICEVIVVVGGANSNNTRQLADTCRQGGARVYQIENPSELVAEWFEGVSDGGITAGTSTPDDVIDAVERRMREISIEVRDDEGVTVGARRASVPVGA